MPVWPHRYTSRRGLRNFRLQKQTWTRLNLQESGVLKIRSPVCYHWGWQLPRCTARSAFLLLFPTKCLPKRKFAGTSEMPALPCVSCSQKQHLVLATDASQDVPRASLCYANRIWRLTRGNKSDYPKQKPKWEGWLWVPVAEKSKAALFGQMSKCSRESEKSLKTTSLASNWSLLCPRQSSSLY